MEKKPTTVKTYDGREITIEGFQKSLRDYPMSYRAAMDDYGTPYLAGNCVRKSYPCGCEIIGNGTLQFPLSIKFCIDHRNPIGITSNKS